MGGCVTPRTPESYSVGRPPKYRADWMPAKAEEVFATGASVNKVAMVLETFPSTIYRWMGEHPEFKEAVARGKQKALVWWEDEGQNNLDNQRYNTGMYELQVANRIGWSRKVEQKTTVDVTVTHDIQALSNEIYDSLPDVARPEAIGNDRKGKTVIIEAEKPDK